MKQSKKVVIEELVKKDEFLAARPLKQEEIHSAIDKVIRQIDLNMDYFGERFPWSASENQIYQVVDHCEWTEGFWTGELWLAYEYTKDEKYRDLAMRHVASFRKRLEDNIVLDHHDLGFLYSLSCVAAYKITGDDFAKDTALLAADKLLTRWQEKGAFIQAWGKFGTKENYRFIIDCLLNIPLLYWASEVSGKAHYADYARRHYETTVAYAVRDDASAFHTFFMDPENGAPLRGVTHQGYRDDSSWARGQAWAVYGIPLNMFYTRSDEALDLYYGMTDYFLNRLPKDNVPYWDLVFDDKSSEPRDSSSAAIACCGLLLMDKLFLDYPYKEAYQGAVMTMMRSLIENYTYADLVPGQGFLAQGVYSYHSGKGVNEANTWGDYFYFEALMRLVNKDWVMYW